MYQGPGHPKSPEIFSFFVFIKKYRRISSVCPHTHMHTCIHTKAILYPILRIQTLPFFSYWDRKSFQEDVSLEAGSGSPGRAGMAPVCAKPVLGTAAQVPRAQRLWRNCVSLLLIPQSSLITKTDSHTYPIFSLILIYFQVDCQLDTDWVKCVAELSSAVLIYVLFHTFSEKSGAFTLRCHQINIFDRDSLIQLALLSQRQSLCQVEQSSDHLREDDDRLSTRWEREMFLGVKKRPAFFLEGKCLGKLPRFLSAC